METVTSTIELPKRKVDIYRSMQVGDSVQIGESTLTREAKSLRQTSVLAFAKRSCNGASFTTRTMEDGTLRLFRTA